MLVVTRRCASSARRTASRSGGRWGIWVGGTSMPAARRPLRACSVLVGPAPDDEVELLWNAGEMERFDGEARRLHVVRMTAAVRVVVGDHHLWPVALDERRRGRGLLKRHVAEERPSCAIRPLRHARVVVAEGLDVANPELLAGLIELGEPRLGNLGRVVALLTRLHVFGAIPVLAVRAGHQDRVHTLIGVSGQYSPRRRGFVIRVGVDRHQRQIRRIPHRASMHRRETPCQQDVERGVAMWVTRGRLWAAYYKRDPERGP